jgi:hypothetical protein
MTNEIVPVSNTNYSTKVGTDNPGMIMILLDQSGSMGGNKANLAATAVNRVIYETQLSCRDGLKFKDRCYIGVIGYGDKVGVLVAGKISEVSKASLGMEKVRKMDGAGGLIEMEMPIWVTPKADGGTPMAEAMTLASPLIEGWKGKFPHSFPPIVINVTDGEPDGFDRGEAPSTKKAALKLLELSTTDGNLLLFNAHISSSGIAASEIQLPNSDVSITDPYAKWLFGISSVLPPPLFEAAKNVGFSPEQGARGMVFNAGAETLIRLLTFGSTLR